MNNEFFSNLCDLFSKLLKGLEYLNGIIKDGKGSVFKRVRFNIDNLVEIKKGRNSDIVKVLSEFCLYGIIVIVVDI